MKKGGKISFLKFSLVGLLFLFFFISASFAYAQENQEESFRVPGTTEGNGKHFEITDSKYLNISLDSSENIEARIESIPEMIIINIKSSEEFSSANITISGFSHNTNYHKYEDDYHNYVPFFADENGVFSFEQSLTQNHVIFIQPRKSTKFIKDNATGGDCSGIGNWDASSKTCTLNQDLTETIQIDNDGITLDGNYHSIIGASSGSGVYARLKNNVTIKNIAISFFSKGIMLNGTKNALVLNNILKSNSYGIYLDSGDHNVLEKNNVISSTFGGITTNFGKYTILRDNTIKSSSFGYGVWLSDNYNTLSGNIIFDNKQGNFGMGSSDMSTNDIDTSNTIEGKPIYYIKNISDKTFDSSLDASSFYCINCNNIKVQGLSLPQYGSRVSFWHTNNSSIEGVTSSDKSVSMVLDGSSSNNISKNTFNAVFLLNKSNNNTIFNNNVMAVDSPVRFSDSSGTIFNQELPIGGNYWKINTYCGDINGDGICDQAFYPINYRSEKDDYPWKKEIDISLPTPSGNSNVLFLPGIKASKLYKENDQLWPPNYFGNDLEELALDENGESIENVFTEDIIKEVGVSFLGIGPNIYKTFIEKLESLKSEGTINDFNLFAYDWRKNVENVAQNGTIYPDGEMKSVIEQIRTLSESSQNKKVTIVAHSMGGLLAKAIMQELEKTGEAEKVDKIVFVSTPQMGTSLAILSMLYGYDESALMGTLISQSEARKLAENMPGVYGLLPSKKYFEKIEEPLINFLSKNTRYENFWNAYGENIDSFSEFRKFLMAETDGRAKPDENDVEFENVLNENLFDQANETHERLDDWTPPANVKVIEIAGWGLDTVSGVDYAEKEKTKCEEYLGIPIPFCSGSGKYEPVYEPRFAVDGDEVVTAPSSLMLPVGGNVEKYWVDLYKYNDNNPDSSHKNILEASNVQQFISDIIKNADYASSLPEYIKTSRPNDYADAKPRIRMSLYSPLDVHLLDEKGNHTGPKEVTDGNGNKGIVFEEVIPDSYYYQFGNQKYVGFPGGENIQVELDGYGSGTYTLKLEEIGVTADGEAEISHTTFKNLPVSSETKVILDIPQSGLENISNLKADFDGDGENDYEVVPIPNGEAVLPDMFPPENKIELFGTQGENDWFVSDVTVALSAEDNAGGSGVDNISYSLDDGAIWQNYAEPLNVSAEGTHTLQYFSVDKKGNQEEMKSKMIKIDKNAPEAKFIFNKNEQKLEIVGIDNLSQNVSVTTKEYEVNQKPEPRPRYPFSWIFDMLKEEKKKILTATLSDEAGHETEVVFERKENNNHFINVFPKSIAYDGVKTEFSKSLLQYKWLLNWRRNGYVLFGSHLMNGKEFLESHYFPKKNETWIMENPRELDGNDDKDEDFKRRPAWKKLSGMIVPYLQTNQGKIEIEY